MVFDFATRFRQKSVTNDKQCLRESVRARRIQKNHSKGSGSEVLLKANYPKFRTVDLTQANGENRDFTFFLLLRLQASLIQKDV
jgi:hypothetical protein